jgi:hypothetical protein
MGEAKRLRRRSPAKGRDDLEHAVRQMYEAGQGVYAIEIVGCGDVPDLMLADDAGSFEARRTVLVIADFLKRIETVQPTALCLLCDYEFTASALPMAVVIITAGIDGPKPAMANGLCSNCALKPNLRDAVLAKYEEGGIVSSPRMLPPISEAGRA